MTVVSVNSSPKLVSGVFTRPYIVKNSSSKTVYLGQDSSLTVATRAFSLPAGSTLNWSGSTELWACTSGAEVGELELLFTGENSFTPGPSSVSIDQNGDTLYNAIPTAPGGATTQIFYNNDLSNYQSLVLTLNTLNNLGVGADTRCAQLIIQWETLTGEVLLQYRPYYSINGWLNYYAPIVAPAVRIFMVQPAALPNILPLAIIGTSAKLPRRYYHQWALLGQATNMNFATISSFVDDGGWYGSLQNTANLTGTVLVNSLAGAANIGIRTDGNNALDSLVECATSLGKVWELNGNAVNGTTGIAAIFPEIPIKLNITPAAATQVLLLNIGWVLPS